MGCICKRLISTWRLLACSSGSICAPGGSLLSRATTDSAAVFCCFQECLADARKALPARALAMTAAGRAAGRGDGDRQLTVREEKKLLAPLLRLRQACCHPQVTATTPSSAHAHCGYDMYICICTEKLCTNIILVGPSLRG